MSPSSQSTTNPFASQVRLLTVVREDLEREVEQLRKHKDANMEGVANKIISYAHQTQEPMMYDSGMVMSASRCFSETSCTLL